MIKSQFAKYCLAFSVGIIIASIICNYVNEINTKPCDCEVEKKEESNEDSKCSSGR